MMNFATYDLAWAAPDDVRCMIVDIVTCGFPELRPLVEANFDIAWLMGSKECGRDLQYLVTQMHLIDLIMASQRDLVDKDLTVGAREAEALRDAQSRRETHAHKEETEVSCAWSSFSSTTQFQRDSEEHARSQFTSNTRSDTTYTNRDYDRSRTKDSRWSYTNGEHQTRTDGRREENSTTNYVRGARTGSETAPMAAQPNMDPGEVSPPSVGPGDPVCVPFPVINELCIPTITVSPPSETIECDENPGRSDNPCPPPQETENPCLPLPSYGRGCIVRYNLSIMIPLTGSMSVNWSDAETFRQSYVCTCGSMNMQREAYGYNANHRVDKASGLEYTRGQSTGDTQRDVHRTNRFVRTNERRWDSSAASRAETRGELRRGSDTARHSESRTTGFGTAERISEATMDASGWSKNRTEQQQRAWGQIFKALAKLRDMINEQRKALQSARVATYGATLRQMEPTCPCPGNGNPNNLVRIVGVDRAVPIPHTCSPCHTPSYPLGTAAGVTRFASG